MKKYFIIYILVLFCFPIYPQVVGDLRQDPEIGFLEIWNGEAWAMVCDDMFSGGGDQRTPIETGNLICRRLSGVNSATIVNSNEDVSGLGPLSFGPCSNPEVLVTPFADDSGAEAICPEAGNDLLTDCENIFLVNSGCSVSEAFCVECMVNNELVRDFPFFDRPIPTLSQWGLILLGLSLSIIGIAGVRKRILATS